MIKSSVEWPRHHIPRVESFNLVGSNPVGGCCPQGAEAVLMIAPAQLVELRAQICRVDLQQLRQLVLIEHRHALAPALATPV